MATDTALASFLDRQTLLLKREREAEIERTSLLLSSCGPKLLERKGLALGALGVASIRIGLGGKRFEPFVTCTAYHLAYLKFVTTSVSSNWSDHRRIIHPNCFLRIHFGPVISRESRSMSPLLRERRK